MYFISDYFNDFSGIIPKDFFARYFKKSINIQWQITLKTDVYISSVNINLDGSLNIKDIRIKNPSDFSQNDFLKFKNLSLKIRPETLFKETIYIENVNFKDADILVELNDKMQINIAELSKQINTPKKKASEKTKSSKFEKKFIIETFYNKSHTFIKF